MSVVSPVPLNHAHATVPGWVGVTGLVMALFVVGLVVFMSGGLYIPVGYDRGKIKWLTWCATGMHPMTVYYHGDRDGHPFQSIHPDEVSSQ